MTIEKPIRDEEYTPKSLESVNSDLVYRYSLTINRSLMADYLDLCRRTQKSAPQEIKKFIQRQLNAKYK